MSTASQEEARVRPARAEDAAAISRIVREELGYEASEEEVGAALALLCPQDSNLILVVERGGRLLGYGHAAAKPSLWLGRIAELQTFAIEAPSQGQGLGSLLLGAIEAELAARGYEQLKLGSRTERAAAHRFYEARGYGREKVSVRFTKRLSPRGSA
ncbi:MAG TPA: GNAT family N-acetyltransferase [Rectinemataceae bacterium]|nr:GNAT family N-acetyltransferase [Rectinemataceae bacterium]